MVCVLKQLRWQLLKYANNSAAVPSLLTSSKQFHASPGSFKAKSNDNAENRKIILRSKLFQEVKEKNKATFYEMLNMFENNNANRRGIIEFIYAAMRHLEEFGVHRDVDTYKKLMDLFPKGKLIPQNVIQREFHHYPMHQNCAIDILDEMETYRVMPDDELYDIVINTFGRWSHPYRKIGRMLFWMPKFKNASPYPLPQEIPKDALEIAKLALKRMSGVDLQTRISVFQAEELEDSIDPTWIVGAQSPTQQRLIGDLPHSKPIFVEGPYTIWIRRESINYFVLRAERLPERPQMTKDQYDDISNISLWMFGEEKKETDLIKPPSVHELNEGVFLGMCATGTSSRDSLLSWIRFLQKTNPKLSEDIPVLFTLKSPTVEITKTNQSSDFIDDKTTERKLDSDDPKLIDQPSASDEKSQKQSAS